MIFRKRQPKRSKKRLLLLAGIGAIAAAYFFSPARGKVRRERTREQVAGRFRRGGEARSYEDVAMAGNNRG